MLQFHIQPDSEIPASKQLFEQIQFAIVSGQYPPGHRLPSTRQLATISGLHRNTISKVYRQLEESGLVESLAGSGIYVKAHGYETGERLESSLVDQYSQAKKLVKNSLDELLALGCNLSQARNLFIDEINWRLRCSARVLLTVPTRDTDAGELMLKELEKSIAIPVQLVPLEELARVLEQKNCGTVVTSRYFIREVLEVVDTNNVRVVPIDIYDYAKELNIIKNLPEKVCLGIVSLSAGTLGVVETILHSLRGNDLLIMTAQVSDNYKLNALVRTAHTIISDRVSYPQVKLAVERARNDLIRKPQIICSENYISIKSLEHLQRELDLSADLDED
ncbi:MAG: GntR family transcriptional regulator [Prochloraceae cyanobacterium]|nr:GntR family transcriptional regulator [Prochloraceae cyanobacterium]